MNGSTQGIAIAASGRAGRPYLAWRQWWRGLYRWLGLAAARRRQRRALARLDARLLRDVGITPQQAADEVRKPPWRA